MESDIKYGYDDLGRLSEVLDSGVVKAKYTYDKNGNRESMELANGVIKNYNYNDGNMITSLTNEKDGNLLSSYEYTYYLDGNQESKTDHTGLKTYYVYDSMGRLKIEKEISTNRDIIRTYEYDLFSNRSQMIINNDGDIERTSYTYDKNNRLLKEEKLNEVNLAKTTSTYGYDNNGNQITKSSNRYTATYESLDPSLRMYMKDFQEEIDVDYVEFRDEIMGKNTPFDYSGDSSLNISVFNSYINNPTKSGFETETKTYDGFNRLASVDKGDTLSEYKYRFDGLRISKEVNGEVTNHIWDGSNIVADVDDRYEIIEIYIRGINLIESDVHGFYIYNAHGDVVQLSDLRGSLTKDYHYDAFGVEEDMEDLDTNPWRYTGEYYDLSSGYYYLRNRYYNPSTGRFLTEDPIKNGLYWYTYCENNPVAFIDPSGLAEISLRSTIEGLGGTVTWDAKTGISTVSLDGQKVEVYAGDKNGSYIKNNRLYTDDGWLFKAMTGMTFDLGKGWSGRIERHGSGDGYQRHVHLTNGKKLSHSQNDDGSPHDDGKNSPGGPPKNIKKALKDKKGWDWDSKENDWINKCDIYLEAGGVYFITYPNGKEGYVPYDIYTPQGIRPYNSQIINEYLNINQGNANGTPNIYIPLLNPVPMPAPAPMPIPVFP